MFKLYAHMYITTIVWELLKGRFSHITNKNIFSLTSTWVYLLSLYDFYLQPNTTEVMGMLRFVVLSATAEMISRLIGNYFDNRLIV